MTRFAIYVHLDGERYRIEILENSTTQLKVRFTAHDAEAMKMAREVWLRRSCFRVDTEAEVK